MRLLQDLCKARGFTSCVALTYNVDLGWFERLVLRQLRRGGVKHFLLFADRARLSDALGADLDLLRGLGRSYAALGLKAAQSFHPKMLLLTGEKKARLYVGSGNLTSGGYGRNREIFECWDVAEDDETIPAAFETVRLFLDHLCAQHLESDPPAFVRDNLDATFGVHVLAKPRAPGPEAEIWSPPGDLFDRLPAPPSPAKRLRLLAPFFDQDGGAAIALAKQLRAKTFQVIMDLRTTNLTRRAYDAIRKSGGEIRCIADSDRRLHAKALVAEGDGWALAVSGSANLSHAAWRGANVELVSVRRDALAAETGSLLDDLATTEFVPQMRELLAEYGEEEPAPDPGGPAVLEARWEGASTILATLGVGAERPTGAEVRSGGSQYTVPLKDIQDDGRLVRLACPEEARDSATILRLWLDEAVGPWAVVHDAEELAEQARPESRAEATLRDLLADDVFDIDAAEKLMGMMATMWQERQQRRAEAIDAQEGADPVEEKDAPDRPDWCWLNPADFAARERSESPAETKPSSSLPLPINMLRNLLFGDEQSGDEDREESESEPEEDPGSAEPELPSIPRVNARAREKFLVAAEVAIKAYLRQLSSDESSRHSIRLLEDMRLIAAVAHYGFAAGALTASQFRGHMIRTLHAFLGLRSAPFPSSLESFPASDRAQLWARAPLLLLGALLAYNTCLADLCASGDVPNLQNLMNGPAPALWMRNIVRAAPVGAVEATLASLDADLPRLRRGALWLGKACPDLMVRIPFEAFARRVIQDAHDIICAEQAILSRLDESSDRLRVGDYVVGSGRDGSLACGWLEGEEGGDVTLALLYDSAFLLAGSSSNSPNAPMHRIPKPKRRLMHIETAYVWAESAGEAAQSGIEILERFL